MLRNRRPAPKPRGSPALVDGGATSNRSAAAGADAAAAESSAAPAFLGPAIDASPTAAAARPINVSNSSGEAAFRRWWADGRHLSSADAFEHATIADAGAKYAAVLFGMVRTWSMSRKMFQRTFLGPNGPMDLFFEVYAQDEAEVDLVASTILRLPRRRVHVERWGAPIMERLRTDHRVTVCADARAPRKVRRGGHEEGRSGDLKAMISKARKVELGWRMLEAHVAAGRGGVDYDAVLLARTDLSYPPQPFDMARAAAADALLIPADPLLEEHHDFAYRTWGSPCCWQRLNWAQPAMSLSVLVDLNTTCLVDPNVLGKHDKNSVRWPRGGSVDLLKCRFAGSYCDFKKYPSSCKDAKGPPPGPDHYLPEELPRPARGGAPAKSPPAKAAASRPPGGGNATVVRFGAVDESGLRVAGRGWGRVLARWRCAKQMKIAVLGGSMACGGNLAKRHNDKTKAWPARLLSKLRSSLGAGVTLHNACEPASSLGWCVSLLSTHVPPGTDVVVVDYSQNDNRPTIEDAREGGAAVDELVRAGGGWSLRRDRPDKPPGWIVNATATATSELSIVVPCGHTGTVGLEYLRSYEGMGSVTATFATIDVEKIKLNELICAGDDECAAYAAAPGSKVRVSAVDTVALNATWPQAESLAVVRQFKVACQNYAMMWNPVVVKLRPDPGDRGKFKLSPSSRAKT
ncbi:hypothetical protein JL720_4417 [Aureococcus anophagefferens]|nr:hypothetical protein JL720_4417 [Aureococcus anophagefferens]